MHFVVLMDDQAKDDGFLAEHGLSFYIETQNHKILFDMGQTNAFLENAKRLNIDLSAVDIAILSHGHYDHGGGLAGFLSVNDHAPIYIHQDAFAPHYAENNRHIGIDPAYQNHPRVVLVDDFLQIGDGVALYTCNRQPKYIEPQDCALYTLENGIQVPDDFHHEQYLLIYDSVQNKRIVISACSHKGAQNIVHWLQPDIFIGGFHFLHLNPDQEKERKILDAAAKELLAFPTTYFTGHCTGQKQYEYLKMFMGHRLEALPAGTVLDIEDPTSNI